MATRRREPTSGRCKAKTKARGACTAPAIKGGQFCSLLADPGRAAQLGRKGGLGNRHVYETDGMEVVAPQNVSDVKKGFWQMRWQGFAPEKWIPNSGQL
jgi:hypothetical protein